MASAHLPGAAPGRRASLLALVAVALVAALAWGLVHGAATGIYRHYAVHGDPSLRAIAVPGPDPADPAGPRTASQLGHYDYFRSERAFHYRTTLAFATGRPDPALLRHDTFQQHPDGVDAWREYTLLMEPVYGFLYRLAGDPSRPLVEFLLVLVPLVHVLAFFPLYGAARELGARPPAAVGAVLLAATCGLGFTRLAGSLLLKETFALLLLSWFLHLHLRAWRTGGGGATAAAALVLVPLLASWHLAQHLVAVVALATAVARAAADPPPARRPWMLPAAYVAAALAAGLTPSLAARRSVLGAPTLVFAAWLLSELAAARWRACGSSVPRRLAVLALLLAALLVPALRWPADGGAYGHVGGLLAAKLRHGFHLPDDPSSLPFVVRLFWTRPFHTPGAAEIWAGTGAHAVLLLAALAWCVPAAVRRATPARVRMLALVVLGYAAAWLFAARLGVVFLPAGALAVAVAADRLAAGRRAVWPLAVVGAAAAFNLATVLAQPLAVARDVAAGRLPRLAVQGDAGAPDRVGLMRWLTRRTPGPGSATGGAPAALLADIALSPELLLYTGRPTVLNSQFENRTIQARDRAFMSALYARDPAGLHAFARAHQADFLVVERKGAVADGPRSLRWMAGAPAPLARDVVAVRLHFTPMEVPGFAPVWDNPRYRVFRVLPELQPPAPAPWEPGFDPWWEPTNFTWRDGRLVDLEGDRARLAAFAERAAALQQEQLAVTAALAVRQPAARDLLGLHRHLALLRLAAACGEAGDPVRAGRLANLLQRALADVDPATGRSVAAALGALLDGRADRPGWRELLAGTVAAPTHLAVAGQAAALAGRYGEAADWFARAAGRWEEAGDAAPPLRRRLWDEMLLWRVAAGDAAEARRLARELVARHGVDEGTGEVLRRLAQAAARP